MPIELPAGWEARASELHQDEPWIWCWELEADVSTTARTVFRLAAYTENIELPFFRSVLEQSALRNGQEDGNPYAPAVTRAFGMQVEDLVAPVTIPDDYLKAPDATFYATALTQSEIETDSDGNMPTVTIAIDNTSRVIARWLQKGDGFMNKRAAGYLVNLSNKRQRVAMTFRVASATVTMQAASLRLEMPNMFRRLVPEDRYDARRCRHRFGSAICGYIINSAAAFNTCGKTFADCIARGADMVTRNHARNGPRNFGGFPGIPVG